MAVQDLILSRVPARQERVSRLAGFGLFAAAAALFAAGCGGGGGTTLTPPGGSGVGAIRGQVNSLQVASASGSTAPVPPQSLQASIEGTNIKAPVNADGSFSLPSVPPGNYTITVTNPDGSQAGHAVVQVTGNTSTSAAIDMLPAGHVSGIVSAAGAGAAPVTVSGAAITLTSASPEAVAFPIFRPGTVLNSASRSKALHSGRQTTVPTPVDTTPFTLQTTSGSDGFYDFAGVPAGFYQVKAVSGSLSATSFASVSAAQASSTNLYLQSVAAQGVTHISGTVTGTDSAGKTSPVVGAYVRFALPPSVCGPISYGSGTGAGSSGSGTAVGGTTTRMSVQGRSRQAVVAPGPPTFSPPVTSTPPASGGGAPAIALPCVQPLLGAPVPAGVSATIAELVPQGAVTDASGHYDLDVPSSTVSLEASAEGYQSQQQNVTLTAGVNQTVDFQLTPIATTAGLQATLTVDGQGPGAASEPSGSSFGMTLTLTNTSASPVNVTLFAGGALERIVNSNGDEIWNSTFGKLLPQYAQLKTLQPGESITSHDVFNGADNEGLALADGSYTLLGEIAGVPTNKVALTITGTVVPPPSGPPVPIEPPTFTPGSPGTAVGSGPIVVHSQPQAPTS